MIHFGDCPLLKLFEVHCSLDQREHRRKKGQWEIPPQEVNAIQTLNVTKGLMGLNLFLVPFKIYWGVVSLCLTSPFFLNSCLCFHLESLID